ncbi:30S ribosomal protein S5 [Spirochaetota bacterium]|nr:30S ribosomal protein S5 [Spirochaetota bacterium]
MKRYNHIKAETVEGLEEYTIKINKVNKVVTGGRTLSFSALVVVGNRNGIVGLGFGKAKEIPEAVRKASEHARKNLHRINLQGHTIPFPIEAKYCSSRVRILPAAEGTGVIAGGNIRAVLEYAGVENILSKTYNSRNAINSAKAVLKALLCLKSPRDLARQRDLSLTDIYN